jgi:hypothetical protein
MSDLCLHGRRRVDIGDHRNARVALAQQADVGRSDGGGERASSLQIRHQYDLARIEQLGRLGHEMHAGEDDHFGIDLGCLACQRQAVADDVCDTVEDFGRLVVVRENDRVAGALEVEDSVDVVGEARPFDRRNHGLHALVQRRSAGNNVQRASESWHGAHLYAHYEHFWRRKKRSQASLPTKLGMSGIMSSAGSVSA